MGREAVIARVADALLQIKGKCASGSCFGTELCESAVDRSSYVLVHGTVDRSVNRYPACIRGPQIEQACRPLDTDEQ